ncbi:MAG TPA: hypothetical protein VFO77_16740 [Actinoplanes sp.]|nr:hypothetical protein [Actinoplanes sp.]
MASNTHLNRFVQPGWTLDTPGDVEQPPDTYWSEKDMDSLFNHPDRKPAASN